ncbi:group III truncated hemoglobin [Parvicella tangerina]|uniref:Group 3 truncated hemoglobin ctb n=1 Tax=Parvicella tangerina TaxID=2829795 RepID=A0A916JL02_9FLAO|nr:group III truncated hemoglobin [Parvicella tangerina]CAG5080138.1 Group 3 truncated hemoglobin ctb [Parvicella tangerina]
MKDIEGIADIKTFVDDFYSLVRKDELLGPIFESKLGGHWDSHLDKMYNFWNTILLSNGSYKGSPYQKHEALPVAKKHFGRWLELFEKVVRSRFIGKQTDEAIQRAKVIGWTFWSKIDQYQSGHDKKSS